MAVVGQFNILVILFPVTVFKAVMVAQAFPGFYHVGKKVEIIPERKQGILVQHFLTLIVQVAKYSPVLPQKAVNVSDVVVAFTVNTVVVIIAALIGTKLLV